MRSSAIYARYLNFLTPAALHGREIGPGLARVLGRIMVMEEFGSLISSVTLVSRNPFGTNGTLVAVTNVTVGLLNLKGFVKNFGRIDILCTLADLANNFGDVIHNGLDEPGFVVSIRYSVVVVSHNVANAGFGGKEDAMYMAEQSFRALVKHQRQCL
jgi:hypothetical protein